MYFSAILKSLKSRILLCFCCCALSLVAQSPYRLRVVDAESRLPVSFASVVLREGRQFYSAICNEKGIVDFSRMNPDSVVVSCVGYRTQHLPASATNADHGIREVLLLSENQQLQPVVVSASNEWAKTIIRRVLAQRDRHNFLRYGPMTYTTYQKTNIDLLLSSDSCFTDTAFVKLKKRLAKRVPFVSECVFDTYRDGLRTEQTIRARKMAGISNPLVTESFVEMFHHAISFYQNSIPLTAEVVTADMANTEYVGPLSDNCLKCYNYQVESVVPSANDTVFVVHFLPVRGFKFNALKGQLHISSRGYALKYVVAEPVDKATVGLRVRADYECVDGRWMPTDLRQEVMFFQIANRLKRHYSPAYVIHTHNTNFRLVGKAEKVAHTRRAVSVDLLEPRKADSLQVLMRPDSLTARELNCIAYMDTSRMIRAVDHLSTFYEKLVWGAIPVYKFDLALTELFRYNSYEHVRTGLGLYTNESLSRYFSLGGYGSYAFGDRAAKYGATITLFLHHKTDLQWAMAWQHDLKGWGAESDTHYNSIFSESYLHQLMWMRFDQIDELKSGISWRPWRDCHLGASLAVRDMHPLSGLATALNPADTYKADEISVTFDYAGNERLMSIGNKVAVLQSGNPLFSFAYRKGMNWLRTDALRYQKVEASFAFYLYHGLIGETRLCVKGGYADRMLPAGLLFTGEGSKSNSFSLVVRNTFQTMSPNEFLSDKYLHFFFSHNFGSLLFKSAHFSPRFEVLHHMGIADLRAAEAATQSGYGVMNHLYVESGLMLNNIIKIKLVDLLYINVGAGGFYRYGYYAFGRAKDNLALKLGLNVSIK